MRHARRTPRCRWRGAEGWVVRARIERFAEPALLLLLRDGPKHGYELLERLPGLTGEERGLDYGNLYRILRLLEEEGLVASTWDSAAPGPAKRVYAITEEGGSVLGEWAQALARTREEIGGFLERFATGERR